MCFRSLQCTFMSFLPKLPVCKLPKGRTQFRLNISVLELERTSVDPNSLAPTPGILKNSPGDSDEQASD